MNWFDAAIVVMVIGSIFVGFKIGLLRAAIVLGSFILAAILGSSAAAFPASFLEKLIPNPNTCYLLGFFMVFMAWASFSDIFTSNTWPFSPSTLPPTYLGNCK